MQSMKSFPVISCLFSIAASPFAAAIEGEPDVARPPVPQAPPAAAPDPAMKDAPVPKDGVAYLGVVSNPVNPTLAEHLGLKPGEGIVVGAVMPDGPADKAGVLTHDIITRVGGDPVGSSEELTHRVSARQPGDAVQVDLIRKGKPAIIEVVLGTRPGQFAMPQPQVLDQLNLDGMPQDLAERVRRMIEGNLGELRLDFEQGLQNAEPQVDDALRDMRERMKDAMKGLEMRGLPQGGIQIHQGATFRIMDDQGSIELKSNEDGKEVTVRDKDNNLVWTGPWDTDQDKAAAPEDIRQRVEALNIDDANNGLRLKFRHGIPRR
jgi:serine protease Do